MTQFVVMAALLALAVLAWVLRPLWRAQPLPGLVVVLVLATCTGLLYALVGTPAAFRQESNATPRTLDEAIAQLETSLQRDPTQLEGWRLLGRAHAQQGNPTAARDAFARAASLAPADDDLQVEYAESRALADPGRRFDADAVARLEATLRRNPAHQRARWFLGIAHRQAGEPARAAATWEPLLASIDAQTAAALRPQLDAARAEAGLAPLAPGVAPVAAAAAGPGRHALTVKVALDPGFAARARLRGDASIFVIARVPGGAPMPVAVERRSVQDLPFEVVLGDDDSPMPTQVLSSLREVELVARMSASGDAARGEGDLESAPVRVALPATAPVPLTLGR